MDRKSVNIGIRSVLNSSPSPLTINEVWQDYIKLIGSPVPLRELGFRSLHDYLRSIPDVVSLDDPNSPRSLVRAVTDAKSKHIAQFVREQKPSKFTRAPRRFPIRRQLNQSDFVPLNFQNRVLNTLLNYSDGLNIEDFREIVAVLLNDMQLHISFDAVLRKISPYIIMNSDDIRLSSQYLSKCETQRAHNPPVQRKEVILIDDSETEDDEYDEFLSNSDSESYAYTSPTRSVESKASTSKYRIPPDSSPSSNRHLVSDGLVRNCFALLDENPSGIWLTDLAPKYEAKFGYGLDPQQNGFDCVLDMVVELADVFNKIKLEKAGDYLLRDARKLPNEAVPNEQGELPKSVVHEIKKLLLNRSNHQLFTDELAEEYKECYRKTLDPTDFGFKNMDGLLKSLNDYESSLFSFKQLRQRTVMYLRSTQREEQNHSEEVDGDGALPCNYDFNFLPAEVCNYDFKLPTNPILLRLVPGDKIAVKMAEVYGPERFFLHFEEDINNLNNMMEDLHIFYENNSNTYELSHDAIRRGMLCACPFHQDSKWHRVIVQMCRGTSDVKVRYFDYGTIREVSVGKLRYLHSDFAELPAQCVRAKLSGINTKKFDESRKDEQREYSQQVGESFFDLANIAKKLIAEIISVDAVNQTLEVHLHATYDDGTVVSIHERLISDGLVLRKEIDDLAEIPLPSVPIPKQKHNIANVPTSSVPSSSSSSTASGGAQPKSKKNRPPPGIPIPPNLNMIATSNTSASTQTPAQAKTTFNGYTQSKMNPLNPPFYPPGYSQPTSMPPQPPPVYTAHPQSMPTGPPMPPPYMYPQPNYRPPPPSMYPYGPYSFPQPQMVYEYYATSQMRPPMPPAYSYAAPAASAAPKPPPGFAAPMKSAKSGSMPSAFDVTGIPLYSCSSSLHAGPCFEHVALNSCCCCGLDCSLNASSASNCTRLPPTDQNSKPEWMLKLEALCDMALPKATPAAPVNSEPTQPVATNKNVSPEKTTPRMKTPEKAAVPTPEPVRMATPTSIKTWDAFVKQNLPNNLNGLPINDVRSSTPVSPSTATHTSPVTLADIPKVTSAKSECEFSIKSEGKESTKDELKQSKLEQLRLFVMYQNSNLKKT